MGHPVRTRRVQAVLAVAVVLAFLGVVAYQTWTGTIDPELKQALIIAVSTALGYYLGSSEGSARKTDLIETQPPQKEPSDG